LIPTAQSDQVALLMSGAGSARDQATRLVYLAAARSILTQLATRVRELDLVLTAMEKEAAAGAHSEQQELAVK